MTDLVSSVSGVFGALLGLVEAAAATATNPVPNAPDPAVHVYAFELGEYQPGAYITVHEIDGPVYEWESIGTFTQKELYEIRGMTSVFTGDSPVNNSAVAAQVMGYTLSLFQQCVMTPVMSNRTMPMLGTTGPSPYLMLPGEMAYASGPGIIGNGPGGWIGVYSWSFKFEAAITPA